jgi:hypothetical protein
MVRTSGATSSTGGQLRVTLSTTLPIGCSLNHVSLNHVSTTTFLIILKRDGRRRAQNKSPTTPRLPSDLTTMYPIASSTMALALLGFFALTLLPASSWRRPSVSPSAGCSP